MNCTTCRYELSQCLDGRLPSGRRSEVINHAESCATCGTFWLELQAAQQLTLTLHQQEVDNGFREQLWERIHAGEGTPSAVFQEDVPLWSKLRYAFTGAAAAAALLIGVSYLHDTSGDLATPTTANVANRDATNRNVTNRNFTNRDERSLIGNRQDGGGAGTELAANTSHGTLEPRRLPNLSNQPSWLKPLSYEVVAIETSRQFEDRYMTAARGIRNMRNPEFDHSMAIKEVLDSANEMRDFGHLLLDLREHQALFFMDAEVGFELRSAVKRLDQVAGFEAPTAQTIEAIVAPILSDHRLANISSAITFKPRNQHEEYNHLMVLNTQRPGVFAKLFLIVGDPQQGHNRLQRIHPGTAFLLGNDCGSSWVAPRSEVNANFMRIQIEWTQNR